MKNKFAGNVRGFNSSDYAYLKHVAGEHNDLKVSLWPFNGTLWISICKRTFATVPDALNYLKEDARSIVEPVL